MQLLHLRQGPESQFMPAPRSMLTQSACGQNGYLWTFPPTKEDLVVTKSEDALKEYTFGKKTMPHSFCPKCGVSVGGLHLLMS